jgi:DNA polymerase-4
MNLASELRGMKQMTGCINVKIRYANFDTHTRQVQIPYTAADHLLIDYAHELFDKLYTRRMLIRLIGVKLSKLVTGANQLMLFDNSAKLEPLYQAMDFLKKRYGKATVQRAVAVGNKAA